jgi:hypothetical protein
MLLSIELMEFQNVVSTNRDLYGVMDSTDEISELRALRSAWFN